MINKKRREGTLRIDGMTLEKTWGQKGIQRVQEKKLFGVSGKKNRKGQFVFLRSLDFLQ